MKRVLLGSTALIGAAVMFAGPAAAEFEITFGGFARAEFWTADQDQEGNRPRNYSFGIDDAEFYISAANTADNGLTYGVNIQLELGSTVGVDEGYLYFRGDDWGTVQLGGNDAPGVDMVYSGDFSFNGAGGYDGGNSAVWNYQAGSIASPDLAADPGDSAKIIYLSPRFSGIALGASYGTDSAQAVIGSDTEASNDGSQEDQFSVGINYVNTINGVDIGVGAGYITSSTEPTAGVVTTEDSEGFHVGFNVGYAGFSFGGSYADNFDTGCALAAVGCEGGEFWEVGGGYSTGPFAIAAGYFHSERDLTSVLDAEVDTISIMGEYTLAPGASLYAEVDFIDEQGTNAPDNEGTVFMVGAKVAY